MRRRADADTPFTPRHEMTLFEFDDADERRCYDDADADAPPRRQ